MAKELTRTGIVGLELTREEIADVMGNIDAVIRKAQCREVNCCVLDFLDRAKDYLNRADKTITCILEDEEI